ncbi:MAG TPA: two-component regulator propeller domain-containing protein [Bacteroidota bacterium]|nr:two-component regulator propeller domain-containing protein [Bacteroidota bacterium]
MKKMSLRRVLQVTLRYSTVVALYFGTASCIADAQQPAISFEHLSSENGLSQNSVLCMSEDSKGFMWFGTYEGLNRYDGYEFKVYKSEIGNSTSLSNNTVQCIYKDHSGVLWIGTEGGLDQFDSERDGFIHYRNDPQDQNSLSSNRIQWITEDTSGTLWIGTMGGGLNQFDRERKKIIRYRYDAKNPNSINSDNISCVYIAKNGDPWMATHYGIDRFDRLNKRFIHYRYDPHNPHSLSRNNAYRIFEDRFGCIWVGLWGGGLDRLDRNSGRFIHYNNRPDDPSSLSNDVVRSIYEDHAGYLWIGTWGGGIDQFDRKTNRFVHHQANQNDPGSLSNNSVLSMYEDRLGILWVGTDFGGINKFDRSKIKFIHYQKEPKNFNSLNNNTVYSIAETNDHGKSLFWIGTQGGGLTKFDRAKNQFTHYQLDHRNPQSINDNFIRTILTDRNGTVWIGTTTGGLNKFDSHKGTFTHYVNDAQNPSSLSNNDIFSLYEDRSGYLWIGTYGGGLNKFDPRSQNFIHYVPDPKNSYSISDSMVWSIYEDHAGVLWVGTEYGGLNQFDREKNKFIHYNADPENPHGLSSNKILCIYEDKSGTLWLGTTNGLNKFDRVNKKFTHYLEPDGLPSKAIQSILEDDHGNLWLGTQRGISKFNPRTNKFKNYKVSEGLQSSEFSVNACLKRQSGEMFFGGVNGFNTFFPDSIKDNPIVPSLVVENFRILNQTVPAGKKINGHTILEKSIIETKEIHLSYKENVFSFEFAALNLTSPEDNQYAYMMEGFDTSWNYIDARKRFATYTNIRNGEYVFRVKGSNNDGVWNEAGTSIRVIITPPFWETWWFYILCTVILSALIAGIYRYRIYRVRVNERRLQKKVDERTQELASEVKEHQKTEEALQRERNLFRILIDHLPDAIYVKDTEGKKTIANKEDVHSVGGRSEAEVLGKTDFDFYPTDTAAQYYAVDRSILQTGQSVLNHEERVKDKDGTERWLLTSKLPLRNEQGSIIGLVGVRRDITERRLAEEKIAEQAHLLDVALDPIILRNRDDALIFWNKAAEFLYGWTFEEAKSLNILHTVMEEDYAKYNQGKNEFMERGECEIELREKSKTGRVIITNSRWSLVRDEHGTPYARLIIVRDITAQRTLEARVRRSERIESLGTLASGMAHDLKNYLVPVKLAAESLCQKYGDQLSQSLLKSIGLSAEHSIDLVQQVLAFVRGVEGRHVSLNAADLLRKVFTSMKEILPSNIEIESTITHASAIVLGDDLQLQQVLVNLINNAKDAMPDGGRLTAELYCTQIDKAMAASMPNASEGSFVVLSIADTGVGISADHLEKIFEPFYTTKEITKGTGLGLSIVAGIVKGHNGFLNVESIVGKGTKFQVYLPKVR